MLWKILTPEEAVENKQRNETWKITSKIADVNLTTKGYIKHNQIKPSNQKKKWSDYFFKSILTVSVNVYRRHFRFKKQIS